jgi:lipopolysaccharide export system protein LptA
MKKTIITYIALLISFVAIAQEPEKISIKGGNMDFDEVAAPGATILNGNVIFTHSGATLTCDKAFYYQKENRLKAFGNVKLNQGDSIHLTSKYLEYNGNTKLAMANGNVVVSDKKMKLETAKAFFDRKKQTAYYNQKGTIHSDDNVLLSDSGIYYMNESRYEFLENVKLTNPKYTIDSKKLDYFTNTGEVFLYENTVIKSKENTIYCNKGFYDTKNDLSYFTHNAHIVSKEREMFGDSITYDRKRAFATAHQNIKVLDTTNHTTIKGHYAEMFEKKDSVFITKRAEIIRKLSKKDSMHIHGDIIMATGKKDFRKVHIYRNVKMYSQDMQAKCDSIFMNESTGITKLLNNPILWAQKNQIVGDTILLLTDEKHKKMDSIKAIDNVFITQKDSIAGFNQIKGRLLKGKILDNELRIVDVEGNAESIYYIRDEKQALIGIDKKRCSRINFELENKTISTIIYFKSVSAKTYPEDKFPEEESKLKGFAWREEERPDNVEAIFTQEMTQKEQDKAEEKPKEISDDLKK